MPVVNPSAVAVASVTPAGLLLLEPDEPEFPLIIPGPQGPIGPQGPSGSGGSSGPSYVDLDHYIPDEVPLIYIPSPEYIRRIQGTSGDAGPFETWQLIVANSTPNTTQNYFDANALIMTTKNLLPGTYKFRYSIWYQSAGTTTGIGISPFFTGTIVTSRCIWYQISSGTTATTGIGDNSYASGTGAIGQIMEGYIYDGNFSIGASAGISIGVITANAINQAFLEGTFNVSVAGDLELRIRNETGAVGVLCTAGTSLELKKID